MRLPLQLLLALLTASTVFASDITTRDGTTYKHARVTGVDADGLRITHSTGVTKVPFDNLPDAVQKEYNYDPAKVAASRKAVEDAKKAEAARAAAAQRERRRQEQERLAAEQRKEAIVLMEYAALIIVVVAIIVVMAVFYSKRQRARKALPPQPTPSPPIVPSFQQTSASQKNPAHTSSKRLGCIGTIGTIGAIAALALVIWFAYNSSKPKLLAKVEVTSKTVRITNGNDTVWDSPTIILNDGFAGPILDLPGSWAPNETRELALDDFQGRLNHQRFNPQQENVRDVIIQARGFQLGIYQTRR